MTPAISLVVPLQGGPLQALRCLEGIAAQGDQPPFEVIIVDDASIGLEDLLGRLSGDVGIVRTGRRMGFAPAMLAGVRRARAPVIAVLRDGAVPEPGWLAALLAAFADETVGVVATPSAAGEPLLSAWGFAARAGELDTAELRAAKPDLTLATLALQLAGRGLRFTASEGVFVAAPGTRGVGARRMLGEAPELTLVIPTLDAGSERVKAALHAVHQTTQAAHEIVIVDNGAPPQGFSAPVNAGIRAARTPYVVVMNDDVELLPGWWEPLRAAIDAGAAVAFPVTVDGAMRTDFAAWCFAMPRSTITEFGHAPGEFFDPSLVIWFQDTDLLYKLRQAGRPPKLVGDSNIRHSLSETVGSEDPELSAWVKQQIQADEAQFVSKHGEDLLRTMTAG